MKNKSKTRIDQFLMTIKTVLYNTHSHSSAPVDIPLILESSMVGRCRLNIGKSPGSSSFKKSSTL